MRGALFFLHGLESSSKGTKGRWFSEHFPEMIIPDFEGNLESRLQKLEKLCEDRNDLILVGSSFGGLMATCYAASHPTRCRRLILLALALNFPEFSIPVEKIFTPTILIIGRYDTVTPAAEVLPLAQTCFADLKITLCHDDHMLHGIFYDLDWREMLGPPGKERA